MQKILITKLDDIKGLCVALNVKRMYAFGSVVTDNFKNSSDVDFLISFNDSLSIDEYTNNYFSLHYKLNKLLGRKIDLVTERTLSNPYFIESIEETKQLIYEA